MRYRKDLLIAACYTLLTIILTYPVSFRLATHIAGFKGEDNLQWRWFLWWFKHSLLTLQTSVTDVSILFAPTGGEQPFYAVTAYVPALALPITLLGGPTISYNLSFLLSFALSGYTTYLLAYYFTRHRLAAFVAGLIFAFYPARFGYATGTFLGQLTTYFLPLYVLALFMLAQRPTWHRVIWAVVVLACLCLTWSLLVAYGIGISTAVFLVFQGIIWIRRPETRGGIKYFAATYGLTFIFIIGFYLPLLIQVLQGRQSHIAGSDTTYFATDLLAFISPSNYHPVLQPLNLLPEYAEQVLADRDDIQERLAYLGIVPILLVLIGLLKYRRKLLFWLVTVLGAMILSLGPLLKFSGKLLQLDIEGYVGYIVLPYALLRSVPILNWSATLGRLNVVTMLGVAVMSAYGTAYLLLKLRTRWQYVLVTTLSVLILFEFLTIFPFPTESDTVPDFYHQLRQEGAAKPQSIINLPLTGNPSYNNYSMHYQTVHHQPVAGGHFIRKPAGAREMFGFLNQLLLPSLEQSVISLPDTSARLGLLNRFGFTKVIARRWLMTDEKSEAQLSHLSSWLGEPHQEGEVSVFEVPPGGQPLEITSLLAGDGWQSLEEGFQLQLRSPADLFVYIDSKQVQPLTLQLSLFAPEPDRYLSIDLDHRPSIRLYLSQEALNYQVPLLLQPGVHQFTFRPQETCQQNCELVNFTQIRLTHSTTDEGLPVSFDDQVTLVGYDISGEAVKPGQPLLIYLYWQGQGRMNADYSAFVHLVSPSGELIAQADYLLGGWLYPTPTWPEGYIAGMPSLFFVPPDTPAGEYQLRVGIYDLRRGERLLVDDGGDRQDSALLVTINCR